jgi:integrase
VALTRDRLDLLHETMTIDQQLVELRGCRLQQDSPKSAAGVRTVHLPPHLIPELQRHLDTFVPAECPYVFPNSKGEPIKRSSFRSVWLRARAKAGLPNLRFHDLRHTGNTLAAATGASTRELMARMGHASMRAALIYQHATEDRDAAIAAALSALVDQAEPTASARVLKIRGA